VTGFDGRLIGSFGPFCKYDNPFGITVTQQDEIIVTSLQQNNIQIFNDRKRSSFKFGSRGGGLNHFLLPYYVCMSNKGNIIVSDSGNHRIKVHKNDTNVCRFYVHSEFVCITYRTLDKFTFRWEHLNPEIVCISNISWWWAQPFFTSVLRLHEQ
jgi:hypothetical protein